MKFAETIGQHRARIKSEGRHPPCISLKELAALLGVEYRTIVGKLKLEGAPKAALRHMSKRDGKTVRNTWYNKAEILAWWEKVK